MLATLPAPLAAQTSSPSPTAAPAPATAQAPAPEQIVIFSSDQVVYDSDVDIVTASGEVKPKNYINIGANAQGELKEILVKEGARVRKGQLLARIENVQPEADVEALRQRGIDAVFHPATPVAEIARWIEERLR